MFSGCHSSSTGLAWVRVFCSVMQSICGAISQQLVAYWLLASIRDRTPDPNHYFRRAYTHQYQARKKVVYYFWITALLSMLVVPTLAFVASAGLFTTFISFSYLDEAQEIRDQGDH